MTDKPSDTRLEEQDARLYLVGFKFHSETETADLYGLYNYHTISEEQDSLVCDEEGRVLLCKDPADAPTLMKLASPRFPQHDNVSTDTDKDSVYDLTQLIENVCNNYDSAGKLCYFLIPLTDYVTFALPDFPREELQLLNDLWSHIFESDGEIHSFCDSESRSPERVISAVWHAAAKLFLNARVID